MQGRFMDLMAAADFLGPGAVEVDRYQTEIFDIVRRRGVFGQRIKQVPATGHPSRFFEETAIAAPTAAQGFVDPRNIAPTVLTALTPPLPTRVEMSVPLKALVSQINYNLFDLEVTAQQSQFAYLQAKDLADAVDGLMRTHDVALWNGSDTSLLSPATPQYFGVIGQIGSAANPQTVTVAKSSGNIVQTFKTAVAQMVSNSSYQVRPTAIYANPMLLDLIDQELKSQFNQVLNTVEITGGFTVKALSTQAGELPLIPEWALAYSGTLGSGATLPAYIVTEDLIEYHWLTDPNPRVFKLGLPNTLSQQQVVVKFGAPVVKGANFAHYEVKVTD
ncbi:MAG TPA: hypothetical protein VKQ11_05055 [Candidatus Sulfotelmatobacter sp.]|nr:hypothetical protein [Candidatus Sulfotelmatobacter sp.]